MRTIEVIDAERRVLSTYRRACAATGRPARSIRVIDKLLDERLAVVAPR
jgi:hypothetical protein